MKALTGTLLLSILFISLTVGTETLNADPGEAMELDYLNIPIETITGDTTCLSEYNGKVILVVNVASKCGFTGQYAGLEELYRKYRDRGFEIIGFPANNFMNQEPGNNEEILAFCRSNYDVTFPMMSKISVKGDDIHPVYRYLTDSSTVPGKISWNFNKFLLDRNGKVIKRFGSRTRPDDEELVKSIEGLLEESNKRE